jgi:hypothetical protein
MSSGYGVSHPHYTLSSMRSSGLIADAYLASDDMFELHCYVCVAILATCKE